MRYCGHFLIKAGGAKNYERDHLIVSLATLCRHFRAAIGLMYSNEGDILPYWMGLLDPRRQGRRC